MITTPGKRAGRKVFKTREDLAPIMPVLDKLEGFMRDGQKTKALDCLLSLEVPERTFK